MRRFVTMITCIVLVFILTSCMAEPENTADIRAIQSYKDIEGVNDTDIEAIEALKETRSVFTYGQMSGTESFVLPNGTYAGFAVDFCALISKLFDIEFKLQLYDWDMLKNGIDSMRIDFTGDLTPTPERMQTYFMTHPIAERSLRLFQHTESADILTEKDIIGMKVGSLTGTIDMDHVREYYPELTFTVIDVESFEAAALMLATGEIDIFVTEGVIDPFFDKYSYIRSKEFFPLVYTSVSMTTANPDLRPVIEVVNKYLSSGGIDVLFEYYRTGKDEYACSKLSKSFTEEEKEYLWNLEAANIPIRVALEQDNYPVCFYNQTEKEFQGIAVDVLERIGDLIGVRYEIVNDVDTPWMEILRMLRSGEATLVSQLIQTEERKDSFLWPDAPYASAHYALLSKSDYPNLAIYQVVRARVGTIAHSAYEDKYNEWFPGNENMVSYSSQDEILDALENGDIDLLMGSNYLLLMQQNYREKPGFKINIRFSAPSDSYFGFNINEALLCSIFSKAQSFVNSTVITDDWTGRSYDYMKTIAQQRSLSYLAVALALAVILVLAFVFLIRNRRVNIRLDKKVGEMTLDLRESVAKLQAVISNYSGAIWSVDSEYKITLFDGLYLSVIGVTPEFLEGKKLDIVRGKGRHLDILEHVEKTLSGGGSQDWISDIDGKMFRSRIAPITDEDGSVTGVVGNIDDITELLQLQKDLENAVKEAEEANKAKSAFLSTMSHEIRTPMNAILGITEIQLNSSNLSEIVREAFGKIYASGDLLLGIINDILDLSKIEAGKLELLPARYEVASLISDTAQLNMMRIGSKPIEFELVVDEEMPAFLFGDELRVKQILNNILSNAFKYTTEGSVKLSVLAETAGGADEGATLILGISDTGQGMTQEQIDKLFDEYSRFNMEANRTTEGTGLGMSITRNLIRLMNGEMFIESEPGKGSTFTVRLPQGMINGEKLGKELAENLHQFRSSSRAQMKRVQITRDPMPYGSVLIVDDVETNIYVARGLMAPYDLKIDSADSGFAAIEKIKNGNEYDIVFMDHMMPKMDGIEATKIIRSMGYAHPVVALTANAVAGQAEIFLGNGFDDFISKPIDVRQLNTILNKLIRDKQTPETLEAARKMTDENKSPSDGNAQQPNVDPQFAEIFARDARKALETLTTIAEKNDYSDENDLRTYIINVHGIKSALANIGKMDLSAVALKLETAGREGKLDIVETETGSFLSALRTYVDELAPQEEAATEENAEEDKQFLREKLLIIKAACDEYDEGAADEALAELRKASWSAETKKLLGKISELLLHSDFDEIADLIKELL